MRNEGLLKCAEESYNGKDEVGTECYTGETEQNMVENGVRGIRLD